MYIYKYRILIIFILTFFASNLFSQNDINVVNDTFNLKFEEDTLQIYFDSLAKQKEDSDRYSLNNKIISTFKRVLSDNKSFDYVFKIRHIGILKSPDKIFRIYNWNIALNDGTYKYYGFIQYFNKKTQKFIVYQLYDKSDVIKNPQTAQLTNLNWFGALYYQILLDKSKKRPNYILLGWDGNNDFSNKKLIDVLYFSKNGKPHFGKNIFIINKKKKSRVIFEYSYLSTMTLRYDEYLKMIVFDHLVPSKPSLKGMYQYYGTDFSYDGLYYKKGRWIMQQNIDVRNPKSKNKSSKVKISKTF